MLDFLKQIFSSKDRELTFVLFDDNDGPASSTTYKFRPGKLWRLFYASLAAMVIIALLIFMFTPLGNLIYNQEDHALRESVIEISRKVEALRDSLNARDIQLAEIQEILSTGQDTTFNVGSPYQSEGPQKVGVSSAEQNSFSEVNAYEMISQNEIIFSSLFKRAPEFPAFFPVSGTLTRGYNPENGHFGIDIATKNNIPFKALADGAVINQDWTANYGYVIQVQHNNGIISIYKHASSVSKAIGDVILKGEILGTVGDVGILSSGPHLHLEIWKNGVPQNPNSYLIKS